MIRVPLHDSVDLPSDEAVADYIGMTREEMPGTTSSLQRWVQDAEVVIDDSEIHCWLQDYLQANTSLHNV